MTTGGGINDLMQNGINQVREGRYTEAYQNFREVVSRDPNNEYAWIWISQTSPDRAERRQAIDRAFQLNPNSEHARQALTRLQSEEAAAARSAPKEMAVTDPADLRAAMSAEELGGRNKKKKDRDKKGDTRASGPLREQQQMVTQPVVRPQAQTRTRSKAQAPKKGGGLLRFLLFILILLVMVVGAIYYFVILQNQNTTNNPQASNPPIAETIAPAETTASAAPVTTALAVTTAPAAATTASAALATTKTATTASGTTSPTTVASAATTAPASTSPAAGTAGNAPGVAANPPPAAGSAPQLLTQAQQLVTAGDYKGAIGVLNDVIKANPKDIEANLRLGSAYLMSPASQLGNVDKFSEAVNSFKRVTELVPTWPGGYARLAEALSAKGDVPGAIAALSRSLELDPNGPERWLLLASLYDKNKQPAEANYARSRAQGASPTTAAPAPITTATTTTVAPGQTATTAVPVTTTRP